MLYQHANKNNYTKRIIVYYILFFKKYTNINDQYNEIKTIRVF